MSFVSFDASAISLGQLQNETANWRITLHRGKICSSLQQVQNTLRVHVREGLMSIYKYLIFCLLHDF